MRSLPKRTVGKQIYRVDTTGFIEGGTWVMSMKSIFRHALFLIVGILGIASGNAAAAEELFLRVIAPHDEPSGYCLDIRGHRDGVRLQSPLQVHTCKNGMWNLDGIFDTGALAEAGALRMPHFELCVEAAGASRGADLMLASCEAADLQEWRQLQTGEIVLASDPRLCITMKDGPGQSAGFRFVRNDVALDRCTPGAAGRQRWTFVAPQ